MTGEKIPKPPRLARFILKSLGDYNEKYFLLSDFDEVFNSLVAEKGRFKASAWYWLHCLGTIPKYLIYFVTWRTVMFKNSIKLTLRNMSRNRITSFINIAGLSVGIAGAILIMLWVQHEISYEKFHKNSERIYLIAWERLANNRHYKSTPAPFADRLQTDFPEFQNIVRISLHGQSLVRYKNHVFMEEQIAVADPSLFQMFTFPLVQGNPENLLDEPNTVVLTESVSRKYFADENPIDKILDFDGRPLKVCGIIADVPDNTEINFNFITRFRDLPLFGSDARYQWNHFAFHTFIQLDKETDILGINQKMSEAMKKYRSWDPYDRYFYLYPLEKLHLYDLEGGGLIKYVYLFSLAAIFILIVSCINFINLATARSALRAREVGIRKVVGSDRSQLIGQFLGESFIFVLLSFGLALMFVQIALPAFNNLVQKSLHMQLGDLSFFLCLLAILLVTGLISGSYPALYLSSFQPVKTFRSGTGSQGRGRFRQTLVILQFAVSVFLIICTFVVLKQIKFMKNADLGFEEQNLISISVTANMSDQVEAIKAKLHRQASVMAIAAAGPVNQGGRLRWEGMDPDLSYLENEVDFQMVDFDYFNTLDARIVAGRNFSRQYGSDFRSSYIINEEAAKLWQLENPVGKGLNLCARFGRIIGVVNNIHMDYKHSLRAEVYYLARMTEWDNYTSLNVRIQAGGVGEIMGIMKRIWGTYNGDRPFEYKFFDQEIDRKYKQEEQVSQIFASFATLSILISCLGLFGLAMFMAEKKTKEIGIRKILGASNVKIIVLLNQEFLRCVVVASIIACPIGWYVINSWLKNYPYRTELNVNVFIYSSLLAIAITILTVSVQAVKAALANPADALRYE